VTVNKLPPKYYVGIPITVTIPGRHDDVAEETATKPKAVTFKAKQLSAAINAV
jgi:hypothetical protein